MVFRECSDALRVRLAVPDSSPASRRSLDDPSPRSRAIAPRSNVETPQFGVSGRRPCECAPTTRYRSTGVSGSPGPSRYGVSLRSDSEHDRTDPSEPPPRARALRRDAVGRFAGCTSSSDSDGGSTTTERQELRPEDWEGVDEIRLEGYTRGWYGVEPEPIVDIRNPAILLFAGREYEITWENGDGGTHNIAIRDESQSVVDAYRTRTMNERGATQSLEFEAKTGVHEYVCQPHPNSMAGYFKIVE